MILLIASIILFLHLAVLATGAFLIRYGLKKKKKLKGVAQEELPFISILVAARNEENNIERCLQSLRKLNYPHERFEVLVGNDKSEDSTAAIVEEFIKGKPGFHLIHIHKNMGKARGKANVLAHLARHAKGSFYFITDADIAMHPQWIHCLLHYLSGKKVFVSGTTVVKGTDVWSIFQEMEWVLFNAIYRSIDEFHPIAAAGNNMALSAEAYNATGGYENIEFSVTEDYQLFKELNQLGYTHHQVLEPCCLALSMPVENLTSLLKQRKRWLVGGSDLPFFIWLMLALYALFLPAVVTVLIIDPALGLVFILLKLLFDTLYMYVTAAKVKLGFRAWMMPFFEIYLYCISFLVFIYYFLPGKVQWKGRTY